MNYIILYTPYGTEKYNAQPELLRVMADTAQADGTPYVLVCSEELDDITQ